MTVNSNITGLNQDTNPVDDLEQQYLQYLAQYSSDLQIQTEWAQEWSDLVAKLKAMIADKKDPGKILLFFQQQMLPGWNNKATANQDVMNDQMNLNTTIGEFGTHVQSLVNEGQNVSSEQFVHMITFLQTAAANIQDGNSQTPPIYGAAGQDIVDQINSIAQSFSGQNGAGTINTIFDINQFNMENCYQYFTAQAAPPSSSGSSTTPPGTLIPTMTQDLAVIKGTVNSISAPIQISLQFSNNQITQMLTMYTNLLKSTMSLLKATQNIPST